MRSPVFSPIGLGLLTTFIASSYQSPTPSIETIYQFPNPTWVENIAVRSNGEVLVTLLTAPEFHLINPFADPPTDTLVHSFDNTDLTGLLGIAELEPDVFAFIAGAIPDTATKGNYSVWKANFNSATKPAEVSKIADMPVGELLNGLAALSHHTLLIGDSLAGNVVRLDTRTGKSIVVLDDATMKADTANGGFKSGINGLRILGDYVYYTNSAQASLHRVKVDCETAEAVGPFETIATGLTDVDDFALLGDGTAFVALDAQHAIERVLPDGETSVFAGSFGSSAIAGPTSAALGKGGDVLYVVTNGAVTSPVNGSFIQGGNVVAISLK